MLSRFLVLVSLAGVGCAVDDSVDWLGDYRQALRQARESHKPLFVEFRCEA